MFDSKKQPLGNPSRMVIDLVYHNPGEEPFSSCYLDPNYLHGLGFSGQVCNHHVQAGVTLESFAPDLWRGHDEARGWIVAAAAKMRRDFQRVREAGLQCLAWTDFVVLPKVLVDRHRDQIGSKVEIPDEIGVKGVFTPDIHQDLTREILKAQVREIFETFPELHGLVVRVGETYLHDLPHHTGGDPIVHGVDSHVEILNLLREEVCCRLDRTLVYRTWMSGIDEDSELYLAATDQVEPHPNLVFSIKHCVGDYHRTHRFSPPLGIGSHRQVVEVQCQREYEGKGAFPNYIAAGVIDGFEEYEHLMEEGPPKGLRDLLACEQFSGIFTWSRGGGWMGPYIVDELWCDINARVLSAWARRPEAPVGNLLDEVLGALGFATGHHAAMREILDLSARAVLRGVTGRRGDIDTLWTRDEFLGGVEVDSPEMMGSVVNIIATGRVGETLADLDEAVRIWERIEALAAAVEHPDPDRLAFLRTSCSYGLVFQRVVRAGWTVLLLGEPGDLWGTPESDRILEAVTEYDDAWAAWKLLAERPECPTLYRDTYCRYVTDRGMEPVPGMGASVARYRALAESALANQTAGQGPRST